MIFDVLIIGGGVSGMQCALVLGSARNKVFAAHKNIGIIMHQRASHLENALFKSLTQYLVQYLKQPKFFAIL